MIRGYDLLLVLLGAFLLGSLPAYYFSATEVSGWILGSLLLMAPLAILQWLRRPAWRSLYPFTVPGGLTWPQLLVFLFSALLALDLMDFLLTQLMPPSPQLAANLQELLQFGNPLRGLGVTLTVLLLGPLGEELLFRGVVYHYLRATRGVTEAVLLSSLLFAFFHPGGYTLQILLFGFLLALLRWRTASLLPPLLLHLFNNSWSLLDVNSPGLLPGRGEPLWWLLVVPGTLLFSWLFYRLFVHETPDKSGIADA
ncbi:MAG: CPBP family intramembrane metalloprotease [Candidatus Delongbacteria bacterium]|nr:CPBP family intramembrane metalloprotease [Candidatus Delongbacteria bacterium]